MNKFLVLLGGVFLSLTIGSNAQALTFSPLMREFTAAPNSQVEETIRLFNESNEVQTYYPIFQDFGVNDESGTPKILPEGEVAQTGSLARWFVPMEPITIQPKTGAEVVMKIKVPADAEPGGHYGALLYTDTKPADAKVVGVAAKTGPIFLVNVLGDFKEDLKLLSFKSAKKIYVDLPATFELRLQNNGTVHETPRGTITMKGWFNTKTINFNERSNSHVLPMSTRRFDITSGESAPAAGFVARAKQQFKNMAIGRYAVSSDISYGLAVDGKINAKAVVWVFPWHLIALVFGSLAAILFIFRSYNAMIIRKARKA